MPKTIAVLSLIFILLAVNWSIAHREDHIANGKTLHLELAPVDPRSLMQGDYMTLSFDIARKISASLRNTKDKNSSQGSLKNTTGYILISINEDNIGTFNGIYTDQALQKNELKIRYRIRSGAVKFATNAFFFQEGKRSTYQPARYGEFRVDSKGDLLLVAMRDKDLIILGDANPKDQQDI